MIYLTRALPFFFSKRLKESPLANTLAAGLPLAIMTLLLSHNIASAEFFPAMVGIAATTLAHLTIKQTFVSIFAGTLTYILLI
ncbi:MAG: hypothetical protein S4CHLAM107_11090 [Chlamydiia bacterium]|nr:hypothetical protein [Chlamydiia bacterium]